MADYTITLTDTEVKLLDTRYIDIDEWLTNFAQSSAHKISKTVIPLLIEHCNAKDISIAKGLDAQIDQALELGLIAAIKEVPPPME